MKKVYFALTILSLFCFTQCAEEELFTDGYLPSDLNLASAKVMDPKVPVITNVSNSGSKVTIEFTNAAAPSKPEGGFELIVNGKRTYISIVPRLYSSDKNMKMAFSISNPNQTYQIYARWNSGYVRSNKMKPGESSGGGGNNPDPEEPSDSGTPPSNVKEPQITGSSINGNKITLKFTNYAAPSKPEGGFELMVDGKRTQTDIIPRVHSTDKNMSMTFPIGEPGNHYYQIYARWNSGYIRSEKYFPNQSGGGGNDTPTNGDDDDDDDNDNGNSPTSGDDDSNPSALPSLKLLKGYEFEDNIGRNVSRSQDGLAVHHLGHKNGKVAKVDGVGAYHFKITPGSYRESDVTYRQELIPRDLPSPYFYQGFRPKWGQEYIYKIRLKLTDNYDIGREYLTLFGFKNDYSVYRYASFWVQTEGDHYFLRQAYATKSGVGTKGATTIYTRYDAKGNELVRGRDYDDGSKEGSGYPGIEQDREKWVTWTVHVKWAYDNSGFLRVYKNDDLFHSYNGPTSYKDAYPPYVKFGLYNAWWKEGSRTGSDSQEMYVDYLRVYVPK
uniref:Heparin lyase I family protein n=1 Tax=Roseihalotalea indica TaxID=2867963 RepID=A0AA49GM20_9BACT|nr:heparin lyase I family protein [Tunicatimonas sp. TK19036]